MLLLVCPSYLALQIVFPRCLGLGMEKVLVIVTWKQLQNLLHHRYYPEKACDKMLCMAQEEKRLKKDMRKAKKKAKQAKQEAEPLQQPQAEPDSSSDGSSSGSEADSDAEQNGDAGRAATGKAPPEKLSGRHEASHARGMKRSRHDSPSPERRNARSRCTEGEYVRHEDRDKGQSRRLRHDLRSPGRDVCMRHDSQHRHRHDSRSLGRNGRDRHRSEDARREGRYRSRSAEQRRRGHS